MRNKTQVDYEFDRAARWLRNRAFTRHRLPRHIREKVLAVRRSLVQDLEAELRVCYGVLAGGSVAALPEGMQHLAPHASDKTAMARHTRSVLRIKQFVLAVET